MEDLNKVKQAEPQNLKQALSYLQEVATRSIQLKLYAEKVSDVLKGEGDTPLKTGDEEALEDVVAKELLNVQPTTMVGTLYNLALKIEANIERAGRSVENIENMIH